MPKTSKKQCQKPQKTQTFSILKTKKAEFLYSLKKPVKQLGSKCVFKAKHRF